MAVGSTLTSITNSAHDNFTRITATSDSAETPDPFSTLVRSLFESINDCNLWDSLCQARTVVVDVDSKSAVSKTTVPGSQYLPARAEPSHSRHVAYGSTYKNRLTHDSDCQNCFGCGPEYTSYAKHFKGPLMPSALGPISSVGSILDNPSTENTSRSGEVHLPMTSPSGMLNISGCPTNASKNLKYYPPPGISNSGGSYRKYPRRDDHPCGDCSLRISEIRLLYFPGPSTSSCSTGHGSTTPARAMKSSTTLLLTNGSILITDGYT